MFFKRRESPSNTPGPAVPKAHIVAIPELFYGGSDPQVYHTNGAPNTSPVKNVMNTTGQSNSKKWLIGGLFGFIFLSVLGLGGWFLWKQYFPSVPAAPTLPSNPVLPPPTVESSVPSSTIITETTSTIPLEIATTTPSTSPLSSVNAEPDFDFPPLIQIDAADLDADSLTDAEEELLTIDPGAFDTDGDSYYDGQEVFNLYNPKGTTPVRLIDSGLIREYIAPIAKYRVYYPQAWELGSVDPAGDQILVSASNGDYIEIRLSPKQPGEDFYAWFGRVARSERVTELQSSVNRFSQSYFKRKDDLVAYFDSPSVVYVIIYHPKTAAPLLYRHLMQVMVQSFRLPGTNNALIGTEQLLVSSSPTVTTSPSSTITQ